MRKSSRNALSSIFRNIVRFGLGATKTRHEATSLFAYEFRDTPVLKTAVWEVSSNDKRDLFLRELLDSNLQGICFSIGWYEYRGVHADGSVSCVVCCNEKRWITVLVIK